MTKKMQEAGAEELAIVTKKGQMEDGMAYTSVIVDGGWCKRTYGHSYNANSGVVSRPIYNYRRFLSKQLSRFNQWVYFHFFILVS